MEGLLLLKIDSTLCSLFLSTDFDKTLWNWSKADQRSIKRRREQSCQEQPPWSAISCHKQKVKSYYGRHFVCSNDNHWSRRMKAYGHNIVLILFARMTITGRHRGWRLMVSSHTLVSSDHLSVSDSPKQGLFRYSYSCPLCLQDVQCTCCRTIFAFQKSILSSSPSCSS